MKTWMRITLILVLLSAFLPAVSTQASPEDQSTEQVTPNIAAHNNALRLDGSGDYLRIDHHPELNPTSAITLEAWVNPDDVDSCQTIVGKNYTEAYWLGICLGKLRFYPHGSGSSVDGNATLPAGVWSHIAVTYDGTTRRYYINGELDLQSTSLSGPLTPSSVDLTLGADLNGSAFLYEFDGRLDEVRLWNRVLTQTEIQASLYGDPDVSGSSAGLVGFWRLDGSGGDWGYIGSNNHGSLQGNASFTNSGVESDRLAFIKNTSSTFNVDGVCNPAEYVGAYEYPSGFSNTYVIHDVDAVYICFSSLEKGADRWASVGLDMDFDRTAAPDDQDYLFSISQKGELDALIGTGSAWSDFSPPVGFWQAARLDDPNNEFTWSAEFRFPSSAFGWVPGFAGSTFGVALFEGRGGLQSLAFPGGAEEDLPVSWGEGFISDYTPSSVTWNFNGYVIDEQSGAGIPDANVQLLQSTTAGTFFLATTSTNGSGYFSFSHSGLVGGTFILQTQDQTGYHSVRAALGTDGRVITPNMVSYAAIPGGSSYSTVTFIDTQNLPMPRSFDRHYLIVYADPVLFTDLWPLIEMKRLQGYQVEAISVSEIEAQTGGYDRAEKIRNYLKARWQALQPDPIYALLVGRHDKVPMRDLGWLGDASHRIPGEPDYAPAVVTDWYYADLDSNWDTDGDHFYGEFLYCDPAKYAVPLEGLDLPGRCPPADSPLREGPYGSSPAKADDWIPEIVLGRLLINERAEVRRALQTSASSEASGSLIKQDALLAGSMWLMRGRTWDAGTNAYIVGAGPNVRLGWPNPVARPFGDDAALVLENVLKPGLSPYMDQITTLYETTPPDGVAALRPSGLTPTAPLTQDSFNDYLDNGYGLVNVNGHGAPTTIVRVAWTSDRNGNAQVDNPVNPAELEDCERNCWELASPDFITKDLPAAPGPVAPIIFANACSTGAWVKEITRFGIKEFLPEDRAMAGLVPAQGKAAAWIGGLSIVPVYGLDSQQNAFSQDIVIPPLLLGDAFWKGMRAGHAAAPWDWRMHTLMLFGDPAYSYWGNPLDMSAYWPQSGYDWFGSGATLINGPDSGKLSWTRTNGSPKSPPVVNAAGQVLVGGQTGLTRFSVNGAVTGSANTGLIASFSPALGMDGVYFVSGSTLYEYDQNLALRRQISLGGLANAEPRLGPDGIVWVPTSLGMARVSGANLPEILSGGAALSPAALTLQGAAIWVGNNSTLHGYAMDAQGNVTRDQLSISAAGGLTAPAVGPGGEIYVGGANSLLYKVSSFPFPASASVVVDSIGAITTRPVVGPDGSVYFGTQNGGLYALNPDGSIRWQYILPGAIQAAPALDPNHLYVVFNNELRVYEPASGAQLWTLNLGDSTGPQSTPVIGSGRTLYITLNNNKLVAVRAGILINPPENLITLPGVGELTLQWDDNSDNETGFRIDYCLLDEICQQFTQVQANNTQVVISQLPVGQSVRFRVQALGSFDSNQLEATTDEPGYSSEFAYSEYTTLTPPAPQQPSDVQAEALSAESIELSWDYAGLYADLLTGFHIYRSAASGGPYTLVGTAGASSRSYVDSGLEAGKWYYYKVAAETGGGISAQSDLASARTRTVNLPAPSALQAQQQADLSILLTWQDNASGESGYLVERRLPASAEFVLTAVLPADSSSYVDPAALLSEGGIEYRVRAYTSSSESPPAYANVTFVIPGETLFLPLAVR